MIMGQWHIGVCTFLQAGKLLALAVGSMWVIRANLKCCRKM